MAKKKNTKEKLKAGVAAEVPLIPLCPVCKGEAEKVLTDDGTVKKVQTCGICEGSGEQPPEWDEACKRAGVPAGNSCHGPKKNCGSLTDGGGCHTSKHGTSHLKQDTDGHYLKYSECLSDISERVLKIRAKAKEGFSDASVDENSSDGYELAQSDDNALNPKPEEVGENATSGQNIVTEKTHIPLIVTASSDRMLELGKRLADYEVEKANVEARKKAKVAEFNGEIAEIEASIAEIAPQVAAGGEMQPVECTITFDMNARKKTCTRDDNGAEVWQHDFSTEDLKKFSLLAKNPLDGPGIPLHEALQRGVDSSPYERACKELGIPGGVTCKGEVFCGYHNFEDIRTCAKYVVQLDADLAVAKKSDECVAEIEALAATLDEEVDITNAEQCQDCGHIQGRAVAVRCLKCDSRKLEEYLPEPVGKDAV